MRKEQISQRQEEYCKAIVYDFMTAEEAKIIAGYSIKTCSNQISRKPQVKARIQELRDIMVSERVMTPIERQVQLTEIARGRIPEFIDAEGNIKLEGEHLAALAEVTVEDWKSNVTGLVSTRAKRIKLLNPINAIDLLNKMDKIYDADGSGGNITDIRIMVVYDDKHKGNNGSSSETPRITEAIHIQSGEKKDS